MVGRFPFAILKRQYHERNITLFPAYYRGAKTNLCRKILQNAFPVAYRNFCFFCTVVLHEKVTKNMRECGWGERG